MNRTAYILMECIVYYLYNASNYFKMLQTCKPDLLYFYLPLTLIFICDQRFYSC